jgi:hypothetical protein
MAGPDPAALRASLPSTCSVTIPTPETKLHDVVSRWSDTGVTLPFAVVALSNATDISAIVAFAQGNGLKIIPASGGHASFLPINSQTIYLDLSAFKKIELNEEKGEVLIGAGVTTGEVLRELASKGWYTTTPNSNAVGMIGSFLGGLSHSTNGLHGFGIDHVRSISIIPFSKPEEELVLTPEDDGEKGKLFNVLCGAGHGMGILTSITLTAWKIKELGMDEDKMWSRKMFFPAPAIASVASLFTSLQPPDPRLQVTLGFLRAPPTAPKPGAPMIMLSLSFYGTKEEAEKVAAKTYEAEYAGKAIMAPTGLAEWEKQNDGAEPMNRHGGFKEYHGCFLREVDPSHIADAFSIWQSFTDVDLKGRGMTYLILGSWSTRRLEENGGATDKKFFPARDRGVFVQFTPSYTDKNVKEEADEMGKKIVEGLREKDDEAGRKPWSFVNNLLEGQNLSGVYTAEQLGEITRVKRVWDPQNVGWNPVADGW